jgi:hypothetical protein
MNTFVPHAELTEYLKTNRVWDLRHKALSFRVNLWIIKRGILFTLLGDQ